MIPLPNEARTVNVHPRRPVDPETIARLDLEQWNREFDAAERRDLELALWLSSAPEVAP